MLSRVADALYWMARNGERTENNAHILQVQLVKMLEESGRESVNYQDWQTVIDICGSKSAYEEDYGELRVHKAVDYIGFSNGNSNALTNTLSYVRENARMTRDVIPNELWEVWNDLYLHSQNKGPHTEFSFQDIHSFLRHIKATSMTSTGIIDSMMSRDLPYHFMKIGQWLERAEKTALIMKVMLQKAKFSDCQSFSEYDGQFALRLVNGYQDYSKKFRLKDPALILQFLISDRTFPRSIYYCIEHVKEVIWKIESEKVAHYSWRMYAALDELIASVEAVCVQQLSFEELEMFIEDILSQCIEFGKIFSTTYYLIEADASR
ncbi:alpha-E domain-containing protein [Bacillus sp. JJ634]